MKYQWLVLAGGLCLAACGGSSDSDEEVDFAAYDDAALVALAEEGAYQQVIDIINGQEELGIADKQDYLLMAQIYNDVLDGVGAEVAIEKARDAGASEDETAVALSRAFLAQRKEKKALAALEGMSLDSDAAYQALLIQGDIARDSGDVEAAKGFFLSAIDQHPDSYDGYLGLASIALAEGKLEIAETYANEAAARIEDDTVIRHVQGSIARYQGRMEDAVAYLKQSIMLKPSNVLALLELAGVYIDMGRTEEASVELDKVYAITPENPMAYYLSALILAQQGKSQDAEYLLLRTGDITKDYPPASRVYGHVAFKLGKFSTARPYLERFLRVMPSDRLTRLALVECLSRRGEPTLAVRTLAPLLSDDSTDIEAFMQAAGAEGALGHVVEARKHLEKALDLALKQERQDLVELLTRRLALSRFVTGDQEAAMAALKDMYQDNSADLTSLTLLANMQLDQGDTEGLAESVAKIRALDAQSALASNLEGSMAYRQRDLEGALDHFNTALSVQPDYDSALKNRSLALLGLRRFEEARVDIEALQEKVPDDPQLRAMYGRVLFELGDVRAALEELKIAEGMMPRSAIVATDHALALSSLGYLSSAISQAQKARRLAVGDEGLVAYIDDMVSTWQVQVTERQALAAEETAKQREKAREAQAERDAQRKKILEENSVSKPDGDEETDADEKPDQKKSEEDNPDEGEADENSDENPDDR